MLDLVAGQLLHVWRLAEREVRRHAPVPDFWGRQSFVESVGLVEFGDCREVGGRNDIAADVLVHVAGYGARRIGTHTGLPR